MRQVFSVKCCLKCGVEKALEDFVKNSKTGTGCSECCKECKRAISKVYRESELGRSYRRAYQQSTLSKESERRRVQKKPWTHHLLVAARARAKKLGLDFDLKPQDVVMPVVCPLLGLQLNRGTGRMTANSPSLDRKDPSKGYTVGNVWVVSWRANSLKSDATTGDLSRLLHALTTEQTVPYTQRATLIIRSMLYNAKYRAKVKGLEFDLQPDDIAIPETCPVFGTPLSKVGGRRTANSPSLDRKDNTKGYTLDNVWVISNRANLLKKDTTLDELRLLLGNLVKYGV